MIYNYLICVHLLLATQLCCVRSMSLAQSEETARNNGGDSEDFDADLLKEERSKLTSHKSPFRSLLPVDKEGKRCSIKLRVVGIHTFHFCIRRLHWLLGSGDVEGAFENRKNQREILGKPKKFLRGGQKLVLKG